eukprot:scaffold3456_cov340-Prasinococcus_capsulatus_cf.AAC.2
MYYSPAKSSTCHRVPCAGLAHLSIHTRSCASMVQEREGVIHRVLSTQKVTVQAIQHTTALLLPIPALSGPERSKEGAVTKALEAIQDSRLRAALLRGHGGDLRHPKQLELPFPSPQ